jgi:hypothetical protein
MTPGDLTPWAARWAARLGPRPARKLAVGAGLAGYSWLAGGLAPFTGRSLLSVLVPGAVLGAIAYGRPPRRIPAPERLDVAGFSYWAIAVALLLEWEASAVFGGSTPSHPSLTNLIDPLIHTHPAKAAAILVWLVSGWALVRR